MSTFNDEEFILVESKNEPQPIQDLSNLTAAGRSPNSFDNISEADHNNILQNKPSPIIEKIDGFSISIIDTVSISQKKNGKKYTAYVVEIVAEKNKFRVVQRYSDFHSFHQRIKKQYEKQIERTDIPPLPILPPKEFFKKDDPGFIQSRRNELEAYLQLLALHPLISRGKDAKEVAKNLLTLLPGSLQGHHCYQLLDELKATIQTILDESVTDSDLVIFDNNRAALQLCYSLEKILTHGLIGSTSLILKKYFWILFDRLPRTEIINENANSEMSIDTMLTIAQEEGKNNLARGRIFLRLSLNNHTLSNNLKYLLSNNTILNDLYEDKALIQNDEHRSILLMLLEMLDQTQFSLWIKDKGLSDVNYYDKLFKEMDARPKPAPVVIVPPPVAPSPKAVESPIIKKKSEERPMSPKVGEQMQSSLWSIVSMSLINEERLPSVYFDESNKGTSFEAQIESDVHRVLTNISFNRGDGPVLLKRVLTAFTNYMPHLGYTQELSLIVGNLLLQLEEEGAFWVLVWLAKKYSYDEKFLFSQNFEFLHLSAYCIERILSSTHPDLLSHFESTGFKLTLILSDWFATLFVYSAPVAASFRIWDVLFLEDRDYIFRIAISIIQLTKEKILKETNLEEMVTLLKERLKFISIDSLLKDAAELNLPHDVISTYYDDFIASSNN